MVDVLKVVYGEKHEQEAKQPILSGNSYHLQITENSRITSIGGSDFSMRLSFLKGKKAEDSVLYSIDAKFSNSSYEAVLTGLTEKYGVGRLFSKKSRTYRWDFYKSRYIILLSMSSLDSKAANISIIDYQILHEVVENNDKERKDKTAADSKDL